MSKNEINLPEDYNPAADEEYMCDRHLEYFKRKLHTWRAELADESNKTVEYLQHETFNEPDFADRASREADTSLELRTKDRYRKLISKIDSALTRIEKNEYGFCEETGEPIGVRRLDARPIATLSIDAQEKHERFEKSHNEE